MLIVFLVVDQKYVIQPISIHIKSPDRLFHPSDLRVIGQGGAVGVQANVYIIYTAGL